MVSRPLGAARRACSPTALLGEPPVGAHPVAGFGARDARGRDGVSTATRDRPGPRHAAVGVGLARPPVRALALDRGGDLPRGRRPGARRGRARASRRRSSAGDLDAARALLPALVGRDPSQLDEPEIARAVVESVAENTVDAVVAPALWAAAAGAPGALALPGGQHDGRHGRPPLAALRALRLGERPARRRWPTGSRPGSPPRSSPRCGRARPAASAPRRARDAPGAPVAQRRRRRGRVRRRARPPPRRREPLRRPRRAPPAARRRPRRPRPPTSRAPCGCRGDVTGALVALLAMPSVLRWLWRRRGEERTGDACRRPGRTAATARRSPPRSGSTRRRCSTCRPASTRARPTCARRRSPPRRAAPLPRPGRPPPRALAAAIGVDAEPRRAHQRRGRGHRPGRAPSSGPAGSTSPTSPSTGSPARSDRGRAALALEPPQPDRPPGGPGRDARRCGTRRSTRWPPARGPGRRRRAVVVGSLTKLFACPGLRLGYVLAPDDALADGSAAGSRRGR